MATTGAEHRPSLGALRLLGEGVGAALIRPDGEIDWWCPNRFDAEPALWALLDAHGGSSRWDGAEVAIWDACPAGPTSHTTVRIGGGRVQLWDGLIAATTGVGERGGGSMLVRLARAERGEVELTHRLRAGTASCTSWLTASRSTPPATWSSASPHRREAGPGSRCAPATLPCSMWRTTTWPSQKSRARRRSSSGGPWPRCACPAGTRHGRRTPCACCGHWLRDSGLAVATAATLGHLHAASRYLGHIGELLARDNALRPLSTTRGDVVPPEREVHGVTGWAASTPVRVGNAASDQVQLDAVATVLDAVWSYASIGGPVDGDTWRMVDDLASRLADTPYGPTSGVWELRDPQLLVSEEIARWHGLQRALQVRRWFRPWLRRPTWRAAREDARRRVEAAIDPVTGRLPQSFDDNGSTSEGPRPDASAYTAAISGLARDGRGARLVGATIEALEQGAFLRRYRPANDGFDGVEATFVPVSWWAVTALAMVGDVDAAQSRADELCAALPPLQPEEWDVERGESLGNTPLLWSHMEAARALHVLQREQLRRRFGTVGLGVWSAVRYLRLRLARHRTDAP